MKTGQSYDSCRLTVIYEVTAVRTCSTKAADNYGFTAMMRDVTVITDTGRQVNNNCGHFSSEMAYLIYDNCNYMK